MVTVTSDEVQNSVERLIDVAQEEPVSITRDGRPVAFLVSQRGMDEILAAQRRRREARDDMRAWQANAAQHRTAAAAELTEEDVVRMVHELR